MSVSLSLSVYLACMRTISKWYLVQKQNRLTRIYIRRVCVLVAAPAPTCTEQQPVHPPDARILKMREYEERNRWLCETVKSNLYRDTVVNWENKTDEKIRRKLVKQRFETLKTEAAEQLQARRERLGAKLRLEESMYQEELGLARETPEERRAKLEARAKELREQRESERSKFAEDAMHRRWRENCDAVRELDSKAIVEETERVRAVQVEEHFARKMTEKEEEKAFDSMMEFERQKQQQRYEDGKREKRDRDNEALRVLNEQMNLQKQLEDEQEDERRNEILAMKAQWKAQEEESRQQQLELMQKNARTREELISFNKQREREKAAEEEKERQLDIRIVEEAMAKAQAEDDRDAEAKFRAREEARMYRQHLELMMAQEAESENMRDSMIEEEERKAWARRDAQLAKENEARANLWNEVVQQRSQQLGHKSSMRSAEDEERKLERSRMAEEIERLEALESRFRASQKANRIAHRMDVEAQIAAHQHEKKLEKMRAEEERKAFRNAEHEYGSMMEKDRRMGIPSKSFGIRSTKWYT